MHKLDYDNKRLEELVAREAKIYWSQRMPLNDPLPVLWMTGLSGSGKTSIANAILFILGESNRRFIILDGDDLREGLNRDLGFSDDDRSENARRVAEIAKLLNRAGVGVIVCLISPFRKDRERARNIVGETFREIHIHAPLEVCISRDPKGLYDKAIKGIIPQFTGITSPYEYPVNPDMRVDTSNTTAIEVAEHIIRCFIKKNLRSPSETVR